jgi:glycosyltransferase involved in cell wall biosynthesis
MSNQPPKASGQARKGLRIAVIGCRGIPAGYSGFETFAEELTTRLVELGHDVTVYCRRGAQYTEDVPMTEYKGVKLVYTPYLKQRELETLSHEFTSILDSLRRKFDLYYFLGTRSAPFYVPLRASRRITVVNTDGLEWKRRKWNRLGRAYLHFAEWVAVRLAADELVSDAKAIAAYFRRTYHRESTYLTNGAHVLNELPEGGLDEWGLQPKSYYLVACRIEPENNIDLIIREFVASGSDRELVIAGGMNYETPYWTYLQKLGEGHRVRFLGPVYGPMLVEKLHLGCFGYLHGHEVGGTNPSLLKAMGCANTVLAFDSEFNAENLEGTGVMWDKRPGSLAEKIRWTEAHPQEAAELGRRAQERIKEIYTWDRIARDHDAFFRQVARRRGIRVSAAESSGS